MARPCLLMLVGSYTTAEMAELSALYARGCEQALAGAFDFVTLHRAPNGAWRVTERLDDLEMSPGLSLETALARLAGRRFAAGLPQMFCRPGMTEGRALFARLGVPMIGNLPGLMDLAADKARTREVVAAAGVNVPNGYRVAADDPLDALPTAPAPPLVVKPVGSDNSDGLHLVHESRELAPAIRAAQSWGDVLVERFVPPGREMRCAVIRRGGALLALPPEEYPIGAAHPVRTRADKLARVDGRLALAAKTSEAAWIVDPDDPDAHAVQTTARRAFKALGCRHYGLFDFRVDAAGQPWFLEAGLYCSFSPDSVIVAMARADGIALPDLLLGFLNILAPAAPSSLTTAIA